MSNTIAIKSQIKNWSEGLLHFSSPRLPNRTLVHLWDSFWLSLAYDAKLGEEIVVRSLTQSHKAIVRGFDDLLGLCLLEIQGMNPEAKIDQANIANVELGQALTAFAFASPEGHEISTAIVRCVAKSYFQLDKNLFEGFLGAIVLDENGHFVGIVGNTGPGNHGYIIPAAKVFKRVKSMEKNGRISGARLGVHIESIQLDKETDGHKKGIQLKKVETQSLAEKAGLFQGDIIISLNDTPTPDVHSFKSIMNDQDAMDEVRIQYLRAGKLERVSIQLD